jgi:hypothetical protein
MYSEQKKKATTRQVLVIPDKNGRIPCDMDACRYLVKAAENVNDMPKEKQLRSKK